MFTIGPYKIKNPFILAPMAGVSQMPFRRLALSMGAGLAPTELVSAKGLFYESVRTKSYLSYDHKIERPFCVQLFGGEAESMSVAAEKAVAMGAEIIDINMGCPVKKVTKINAGSALMVDFKRAAEIVSAMRAAVGDSIPITAKIRSGWDQDNKNFIEVGKALQDVGIAALAIHPRTRAQAYSGRADWTHIAQLKDALTIPVIGNGDVQSYHDAARMKAETNCDAVMVGRAALGNPWIFQQMITANGAAAVANEERITVIIRHLSEHISLHEEIFQGAQADAQKAAVRSFRSHLIWYSKGLSGGAVFRQKVMQVECPHQVIELIHAFFGRAQKTEVDFGSCDDGIDYRQAFG